MSKIGTADFSVLNIHKIGHIFAHLCASKFNLASLLEWAKPSNHDNNCTSSTLV